MHYCAKCKNERVLVQDAARAAKRLKDYPPVPCAVCGEMTERFHERDRFCSSRCRFRDKDTRKDLDKVREQNAKWRSWNFDYRRDYMLRRTYGITQAQYEDLLAKQGGGCAICGKTPEEEGRNLAVDHDHLTNEIFGVLCMLCNKIIVGKVRNPEVFARAANYLTEGTGLFAPKRIKKGPKRARKRNT
jgi:hypothetical protein